MTIKSTRKLTFASVRLLSQHVKELTPHMQPRSIWDGTPRVWRSFMCRTYSTLPVYWRSLVSSKATETVITTAKIRRKPPLGTILTEVTLFSQRNKAEMKTFQWKRRLLNSRLPKFKCYCTNFSIVLYMFLDPCVGVFLSRVYMDSDFVPYALFLWIVYDLTKIS